MIPGERRWNVVRRGRKPKAIDLGADVERHKGHHKRDGPAVNPRRKRAQNSDQYRHRQSGDDEVYNRDIHKRIQGNPARKSTSWPELHPRLTDVQEKRSLKL
jgi:hypothetical protein